MTETPEGPMSRDSVVKAAFGCRDALLTQAYVMVRDFAMAEDVVQDAFLVVMEKWRDYVPGTPLFPWVRKIVHYKALQARRDRKRDTTVEPARLANAVEKAFDESLDQARADEQRFMRRAYEHCMARLAADAREILLGFYWRKESTDQLAAEMGRTGNAIRLKLSRTRTWLRKCVAEQIRRLTAEAGS